MGDTPSEAMAHHNRRYFLSDIPLDQAIQNAKEEQAQADGIRPSAAAARASAAASLPPCPPLPGTLQLGPTISG